MMITQLLQKHWKEDRKEIMSGTGAKKNTHDFHCRCGHQGGFWCGWAGSVQENYFVTRPHMGGLQGGFWCVDNQIINEQEYVTWTEDDQIAEIEDHIKTLSCNQSLLSSTQNSIESIATPQEADLDDEQISCSAGFTTVLAGATSKCGTIVSLSLWKRRLDVQLHLKVWTS